MPALIASTVPRTGAAFAVAAAIGASLLVLAFVVAPRSCKGGLEVYVVAGGVALLLMIVVPFIARVGRSLAWRLLWALGFAVLGVGTWLAGLVLADIRFICGMGYL